MVIVDTFPMPAGWVFTWHTHADHQLVWAEQGVLTIATESATWILPPTRALWIPADRVHEQRSSGCVTLRTLYLKPDRCPVNWSAPTPVAASQLLVELIGYLDNETLAGTYRAHAEALLVDLLQPVAMTTIDVRMPAEDRALRVAQALRRNPADGRTLAEWGREVGASARTLARAFLAGTGITFGRWRTLVRLQAALPPLAMGEPVSNVARRLGYSNPSAFVAAFRRETGLTPGMYFRGVAQPHQHAGKVTARTVPGVLPP